MRARWWPIWQRLEMKTPSSSWTMGNRSWTLFRRCQSSRAVSALMLQPDRLRDRVKNRCFWPPRGNKGSSKGRGQGGRKGRGAPQRKSLAERIASSLCRICGQRGHWKAECPQNRGASNQDISNFAAEIHDDESEAPPGDLYQLPYDQALKSVMPNNSASTAADTKNKKNHGHKKGTLSKVPALINMQSHALTLFGQREELVDPVRSAQKHMSTRSLRERLMTLCPTWGKLREAEEFCDRAFLADRTVDQAVAAILDTGASRTVIGKAQCKRFLGQFPTHFRSQTKTAPSQVIFRFGNNGILPSLHSAYIPYGKKWFKVEVVDGKTPFLLSNAVMRQLRCKLDFEANNLWIPESQQTIPLKVGSKGLYYIDMVDFLGLNGSSDPILLEYALDRELPAGIRDHLCYVTPPQTARPTGVTSLRQWGNLSSTRASSRDTCLWRFTTIIPSIPAIYSEEN